MDWYTGNNKCCFCNSMLLKLKDNKPWCRHCCEGKSGLDLKWITGSILISLDLTFNEALGNTEDRWASLVYVDINGIPVLEITQSGNHLFTWRKIPTNYEESIVKFAQKKGVYIKLLRIKGKVGWWISQTTNPEFKIEGKVFTINISVPCYATNFKNTPEILLCDKMENFYEAKSGSRSAILAHSVSCWNKEVVRVLQRLYPIFIFNGNELEERVSKLYPSGPRPSPTRRGNNPIVQEEVRIYLEKNPGASTNQMSKDLKRSRNTLSEARSYLKFQ